MGIFIKQNNQLKPVNLTFPKAAAISDKAVIEHTASMFTTSTYSNDTVEYIGSGAFCGNSLIETVQMSNCITIYNNAFYECDYLKQMIFPKCTTIGNNAFQFCGFQARSSGITLLSFPECSIIGNSAFQTSNSGAAFTGTINFPKCKTIGYKAFYLQYYITAIDFPLCETIGAAAFGQCSSLSSINLPNLRIIEEPASTLDAFGGAFSTAALTTVAFSKCSYLGAYTFYKCSSLITISFPSCTYLGHHAFADCVKLESANFSLATNALSDVFQGCSALSILSLGCSRIYTFGSNCSKLKALYLWNSSVVNLTRTASFTFSETGIMLSTNGGYGNIYVPASLYTAYCADSNWATVSSYLASIS